MPRLFHRPACTLFETLCTMRPSQIFNTAQTMVNDGLALHEHPAHCQEFWTSVMEVAQIQLDDDHRHATIHSFLDDVPRNISDFRRALLTILPTKNITLRHYTPKSELSTTPPDPMTKAVQNLQDMQVQAQMFLKRMQTQEALLTNLASAPPPPPPPPPTPALPSLLAWNGNPHRAHMQNELAEANRQLDMLNTVVYDYETLREKHDETRRKAAAQIADYKNNLASAHRVIEDMRRDSKQGRAEVERLEIQIRKLKAMQRKFVTDLQAARLGCEQEVARRLGVERGLRKAHGRHDALILRVALDAWRFRFDVPSMEHRRRAAEFRATSVSRLRHSALILRVALDAWRFCLHVPSPVAQDHRGVAQDHRGVAQHHRGVAQHHTANFHGTASARVQHAALILRVALDAWRFRLDTPSLEHRRRVAHHRATNYITARHLDLFVRIAWQAWMEQTHGARYGQFQAHKTWETFTRHAALHTALRLSRRLGAWHVITQQHVRARAMADRTACRAATRAWHAWSKLAANDELYATMIAARRIMALHRRQTQAWRAASVAARVARKYLQHTAWQAWRDCHIMVRECAVQAEANAKRACLCGSFAAWRQVYECFARDLEWEAQQHLAQALWMIGGMPLAGAMVTIVYAGMTAEQQAQVDCATTVCLCVGLRLTKLCMNLQVFYFVHNIVVNYARSLALGTVGQVGFGIDCIDAAAQQLVAEHWVMYPIEGHVPDVEELLHWLRLAVRSQRTQGGGHYFLMCRLLVKQQELLHQQAAEHREYETQCMEHVRFEILRE